MQNPFKLGHKNLLIAILFIGYSGEMIAQDMEEQSYSVVHIEVTLKGSTNVNKFNCDLDVEPMTNMDIEVTVADNGFTFSGAVFELPSAEFACGQKLMTKEMQQLLKVDQFPDLFIEVKNFKEFEATAEDDFRVSSDIRITICDKSRDEVFTNGYFKRRGNHRYLGGYHEIQLTNYGIDPPKKMLGTVVTDNTIGLEFEIKMRRDK